MNPVHDDNRLEDRIVSAFLLQYAADRAARTDRSLSEYLVRYPGHERAVAREWVTVTERGIDTAAAAVAPAGSDGFDDDSQRRLGPYWIEREIGRGGQASVFEATDTRIGRAVALKVLRTPLGSAAQAITERFRREAEVLARLDHPAICVVHDVDLTGDRPYLAMRLVHGESLEQRFAAARADAEGVAGGAVFGDVDAPPAERLNTLLAWLEQCARALHVAHENGLVHRDVKPANLMVTTTGGAVILDFGLAQRIDPAEDEEGFSGPTLTGQILGTPAYLAPEVLRDGSGPAHADPRVDVYALGVVMYECLTMRAPFTAPTRDELYRRILSGDFVPVRQRLPELPRDVAVVCETALACSPDRRYRTAGDFADELERLRRGVPILARPPGLIELAIRWVARHPLATATASTIVVGLSIGLLVTLSLLDAVAEERDEKDVALGRLEELLGLADARVLARLEAERGELVYVPTALATAAWIDRTDDLLRRAPLHVRTRDALRETALPWSDDARLRDRRANAAGAVDVTQRLERLAEQREALVAGSDGVEAERAALTREIDELEALLRRRRTWEYASTADAWRDDALSRLIDGLGALREHANGVRDRWDRTLTLARRAAPGGDLAADWARVVAELETDERFAGVEVAPQFGLVPLGRDPASGLQEFAFAPSGDVPERAADGGALACDGDSAIVFVLLPPTPQEPGGFVMGDRDDDDGENERGGRVVLDAFFLAKHETTQGQWLRLTGRNPSYYPAGRAHFGRETTLAHPVEWVTWPDATAVFAREGLALPTEAQWEYALRAGTRSRFWTGAEPATLDGAANLYDRDAAARGTMRGGEAAEVKFADGWIHHAPVGTFRANPFGLHDLAGNVAEWCRDGWVSYDEPTRPGDGLRRAGVDAARHALRGGSFYHQAEALASTRRGKSGLFYGLNIGCRAARPLQD